MESAFSQGVGPSRVYCPDMYSSYMYTGKLYMALGPKEVWLVGRAVED